MGHGNSSSGIIEAPATHTPTVNVGDRQRGRLRALSVIDCAENADAISAAITRALSPEFQEIVTVCKSPFGAGGASRRIKEIIRDTPLEGILRKEFYDLDSVTTAEVST